MRPPRNKQIDHHDHDGLNNTRANLRICTHTENARNRLPLLGQVSIYKGVIWDKERSKWRASIVVGGRYIQIGRFSDELLAAEAYNIAATQYFGDFALLNYIPSNVLENYREQGYTRDNGSKL